MQAHPNPYSLKKEIIVQGKTIELKLKDYQKQALQFIISHNYAIISMDVGTGKSLTMFCTAFYKLRNGSADYCIIVGTPKSVLSMKKDMLKNTNCEPVIIDDNESFIKFFSQKDIKIAFMSYQMKSKLTYEKNRKAYLYQDVDSILQSVRVNFLFDEVHKLKNPDSYVTKAFTQLTKYCHNMYGFSGTVYSSNIMDIFNLCNFFDESVFGSYISFVRSFIVYRQIQLGAKTINQIARIKNYDLLRQKLSTIMYSYYPELNVHYHENYYDLSGQTKEDYIATSLGLLTGEDVTSDKDIDKEDQFEDDNEMGDGLFTYSARMIKMQYVLDRDENKQRLLINTVKESLHKGCIVYVQYHKTLELLGDLFTREGIQFRQIHGKMNIKKTEENMDWFTSDSVNKVLFLSDAGGESLNLQVVNDIIFYNVACPIGKLRQVAGRICRLGSSYSQFNIKLLLAKDTLDQYKYMYNTSLSEIYMNLFGTHISLPSAEGINSFNSYLLQQLRNTMMWQSEKTLNKKDKSEKKPKKEKTPSNTPKPTNNSSPKSFWNPNSKNKFK